MTPPASGSRWLARGLDLALYVALPLVGLLVLGWDWRPIVLLYWLENITVGGVTFIGLIRARIARRAAARCGPPSSRTVHSMPWAAWFSCSQHPVTFPTWHSPARSAWLPGS